MGCVLFGFVSTLLALAVTPVVRTAAVRSGVIDAPGNGRIHQGHVPRLGGAVVAVLVAIGSYLGLRRLGHRLLPGQQSE